MNIFILSENPIEAAQMLCNKHVVKMVVESAQMLSTTHRVLDGVATKLRSKSGKTLLNHWTHPTYEDILYKTIHVNHPCTIWTRESSSNYEWHYAHFEALCDEYTHRYGKIHHTDKILRSILAEIPKNIRQGKLTKFALAMKSNPECISDNPVYSYREYYKTKQKMFKMEWTSRDKPLWFNEEGNYNDL